MSKPTRKAATIIDVARQAGVSPGTVSRVLNRRGCPPQTRQRVQEAMEALNYVPNHLARSLKRQVTEQIALVIPDIANPVYVAMAKSVQREAHARGYRLSLVSTEGNSSEERSALQSIEGRHNDGIIICSLKVTPAFVREVEAAAPHVCVIGTLPDEGPVDNVRVDSATGVELGVQHLVDQGRRAIAFINGIADTVPAQARARGYAKVLGDNHLTPLPARIAHGDFTPTGGYRAMDALLERGVEVDAVFCANDVMALGALRRLREAGLEVPRDVALVGMDDIDMARLSTPTLTSVSLLAAERGRIATELLLERLASPGSAFEPRTVTVMPRLLVRESSTDYIVGAGRDRG